jgi:hypothetical protein
MADDLDAKIKLSQQLVMTPQLQMAIRLLATPSSELAALIAPTPGVEPAEPGDPDPLQMPNDEELELQTETGVTPWSFLLERPAALPEADADVWIFGNPPVARANRAVLPRLRGTGRDAAWLFRALRQRSKTYERVVEALLEARPQLAIAGTIAPVPIRQMAAKIGMHESTITRVCSACRVQNLHGVWSLTATKRGIAITQTAS